jgi:hypothetical protein
MQLFSNSFVCTNGRTDWMTLTDTPQGFESKKEKNKYKDFVLPHEPTRTR